MPRPRNQLPSLNLRKARYDKRGRLTHRAQYYIYDGRQILHVPEWGIDLRGLGEGDAEAAQAALRAYIARQHQEALERPSRRTRGRPAAEMPLEDVISHYMTETVTRFNVDAEAEPAKARNAARQRKVLLDRMEWLLDYWTGKVVDDVDKGTCSEFTAMHSASTARRCLEDLRAAINLAEADRLLAKGGEHVFHIPPPSPPRYGFFTRSQFARLVWAAYRAKGTYTHSDKRSSGDKVGVTKETGRRPRRHLARFMLMAVYTGTRTDRIEQASFYPEPGRPWIDVEGGIFYRSWDGERVPDNKRADPVRIPVRLLSHLRRWKRNGARYVVEYQGRPVGTASAFFRLLRETLSEEERKAQRLNRHACKHTAATWLMQSGQPIGEIAGFLSTDERTIVRHYGHHHPDYQSGISEAFSSGAGRIQSRRDATGRAAQRQTAATSAAVAAEVRQAVRDLMEIAEAPVAAFSVLDSTPDDGLAALREAVKRSARSGEWSDVLGNVA